MAISSVTPKLRRDAGERSPSSDEAVYKTRTKYFDVVHDAGEDQDLILADSRLPQPKELWGPGTFLRVTGRRVSNAISTILSEVAVDYESVALSLSGGSNPLDVPPKIRGTSVTVDAEIDVDALGDPIQTITQENFDPLPREQFRIPLLQIERNVGFDPSFVIEQYLCSPRPATNSDTFRGRAPGSLTIWDMTFEQVVNEDFTYYAFMVQLARRDAAPGSTLARAWWLRVKAQGWMIHAVLGPLAGQDGFVPARRNGQPVGKPVLHDILTGDPLAPGADAQWYEFRTRPSLPFYGIGILSP